MPRTVAQLTGMFVTAIVVFGTDLDVYYAMPLGIFAGAVATLLVTLSEYRALKPKPVPVKIDR
jgi:hypothetical protein